MMENHSHHHSSSTSSSMKSRSSRKITFRVLLVSVIVIIKVIHDWKGLVNMIILDSLSMNGGFSESDTTTDNMNGNEKRSRLLAASAAAAAASPSSTGREFTRIHNITTTSSQQQQQPLFFIPRKSQFHMPFVHILKTRFMQTQASLEALGKARLELFKSFCLPSIVNQSSQKFLWMIKADPNLPTDLLEELLTLLKPYPNVYLVADDRSFDDTWWNGQAPQDLLQNTKIYTGNQELLEDAIYHATDGRGVVPILETRLDADDALHVQYLERVQEMAMQRLVSNNNNNNTQVKWTYWGVQDVMEWHWIGQNHGYGLGKQHQEEYGVLHPRHYMMRTGYVPTPGLTLGVAAGATVPTFNGNHAKLKETIQNLTADQGCGLSNNTECIQYLTFSSYPALRTRCPTSASMVGIDSFTKKQLEKNYNVFRDYWIIVKNGFKIDPTQAKSAFHHLTTNLGAIAQDALLGQCTASHSCRPQAKEELERLLNSTTTK